MISTVRLAPIRLEPEKKKVKELRLILDVFIEFAPLNTRKISVLVDTGAQVNLIRRGITFPQFLIPVKRPLKIAMASQAIMAGGEREVYCLLTLMGKEIDVGEDRTLEVPTIFYEADIGVDAILSYEWLAMYDFVVNPNRHALMKKIQQTGDLIVIPGKRVSRLEVASTTRVDTPNVVPTK